ncbi:hypothetical protein JL101_021480 [Skermanella rosea]|uniref:hypothetical protein n=1 Tax=Skermanella rosea TaxID=1817965 RepID=UPI001934300B|nr:hypothetical protein [Skermanella rosea]UEM02538.1 hypothetical protein JL101_021480 [Skermanella rosea]
MSGGLAVRTLGKLLVIWGVLLPLITLPSTAAGLYGIIPLLKISLWHMDARIGPVTVAYETIVVGALILVGVGLSFCVLPRRERSRTRRRGPNEVG